MDTTNKRKDLIYFPSCSTFYSKAKVDKRITPEATYRFYSKTTEEYFRHKFFLLSAGANYKKKTMREDMGLERSLVLGDSGGFQIATGVLKYETRLIEEIFEWLENNSDVAMNIDVPPRMKYEGRFEEALEISLKNFKYFDKHQTGKTEFLNVLQPNTTCYGYKIWYEQVKDFEFKGWSLGEIKNMSNIMYCMALLLQKRELEKKSCKWIHFLGETTPDSMVIFGILQEYCNRYYPQISITCDSSTPVKQIVFGNWIFDIDFKNLNWNYLYFGNKGRMEYNSHGELPCGINCPVCRHIHFSDIEPMDTNATDYMTFHNLYMYFDAFKKLNRFSQSSLQMYEAFYSKNKEFYKIIVSIDEMFKNPDKALLLFEKYKPIYNLFSNKIKNTTDTKILADLFD